MGIRPTFIDTFATELAHYGLGDALWCPEPQDGRHGTEEVQIGDVGYLDDKGSFVRLFNIFYDKDHPVNKHGVPDEFEPLRTNRRLKRTQQPIEHQGPFTSRGVSTVGTEKVMNAPT
ncbi:hypothetical protein BDW22DRAFT_961862 [Trametopsis cervina]|nr:hypothetical protein BDW22DRAFT_961862 [Trametopsis cervina]